MSPRIFFLLFFTILDIVLLFHVGFEIGALFVVAECIFSGFLGYHIIKRQISLTFQRFQVDFAFSQPQVFDVVDSFYVLFGGVFLMIPGLLTDVIGAVLIFGSAKPAFRNFFGQICPGAHPRFTRFVHGSNFENFGENPTTPSNSEQTPARVIEGEKVK